MSSGRVGKAIVLTCFFTAGYGRHRKLGVGFRTAGYGRHRSQWESRKKYQISRKSGSSMLFHGRLRPAQEIGGGFSHGRLRPAQESMGK